MACLLVACSKDALEPSLEQEKWVEGGITRTEDVLGLLYGAYDRMTRSPCYGRDVIIYGEVRADNAFANGKSGRLTAVARMKMETDDEYAYDTWSYLYELIASCNIIIGLDPNSIEGNLAEISHYIGQAYVLRAMGHFDLLKLYGQQHVSGGGDLGIPYIEAYKGKDMAPVRNSVAEVKIKMESDLEMALSLMSPALNDASRVTISTWAVYALQSRTALYFGDWNRVIPAAEAVINSGAFQIIPREDFISSWHTKSSVNSVFELAYSSMDNNGVYSLSNIYRGPVFGDIQALEDILTIFDEGDVRADTSMIGIEPETGLLRNLGKYPSADWTDNVNLIRYEEVILNYAEALFETGRTAEALAQLNMITAARGAQPWPEVTKSNMLQERRRELCFEGFRHDDLARNGMDIPLVSPLEQTHKGPSYGSYNYAFPIPVMEINANPGMVQNQGYQQDSR
jgi:hypothetical protein